MMFLRVLAVSLPVALVLAASEPAYPGDVFDILDNAEDEQPRQLRRHASPAFLKYGHHIQHLQAVDTEQALDAELDLDASVDADASVDSASEDAAAAELDVMDDAMTPPMALPGRHPAVEKALDGMQPDLQNLAEKKQAAKQARGELEAGVSEAVFHMNDAVSIKHAVAEKEAELRRENGKLKVLEWDAGKVDTTRNNLVSSLHRMLGPKMMFARERFEKKQAVLQRESQAAAAWNEKREQMKASAMELIKKKKESQQSLLQAEEAIARAKESAELAGKQYETYRKNTAEKVQSYRYAETRFKAEVDHEKAAEAAALAARESMEKLHRVYAIEQQKVDDSIGVRKNHLEGRIHQIQEARQKSSHELTDLKQKYKDWQERQRERTAAVVAKGQATAAASDEYASRQQQVLDSASAKVVRDAEGAGDWDGWGSDYPKVKDEELDE